MQQLASWLAIMAMLLACTSVTAFLPLTPHHLATSTAVGTSQRLCPSLNRHVLRMSTEANDGRKRSRRRSRKGGKSRAEKLEQGEGDDPLAFGRDWEVDGLIQDEPKGTPLPRMEDFKKAERGGEEGARGEVYLTPLERAKLGLDKKKVEEEGPVGAPGYFDLMKTVTWWGIGLAIGAELLVHSPLVKYLPGYVPPAEEMVGAAGAGMMGM